MTFKYNPNMPDITSKDAERVYSIGKYHAQLVLNPPMAGVKIKPDIDKDLLITYLYALAIYEGDDLILIITSEITSKKIISVAPDNIKDELRKPSLCTFNADGSQDNLGKKSDWSNIELFCNKCFEMIGERLGETASPILIDKTNTLSYTTTAIDKIKEWHFGKIIIILTLYIVMVAFFIMTDLINNGTGFSISDRYVPYAAVCIFLFGIPTVCITWIWLTGLEKKQG